MSTYIYDKDRGCLVDKDTGAPSPRDPNWKPEVPYIASDLPGYRSPVTKKWIEGRAARREDLARTGCRPVEPDECPVKAEVAELYDKRLKQKIPPGVIA